MFRILRIMSPAVGAKDSVYIRALREGYFFHKEMKGQVEADDLHKQDHLLLAQHYEAHLECKSKLNSCLSDSMGDIGALKRHLTNKTYCDEKKRRLIQEIPFTAISPSFASMHQATSECTSESVKIANHLSLLTNRLEMFKGSQCLNSSFVIPGTAAILIGVVLGSVLPVCKVAGIITLGFAATGALVFAGALIGGSGVYVLWKSITQGTYDKVQLNDLKKRVHNLMEEVKQLKQAAMHHAHVMSTEKSGEASRLREGEDVIDLKGMWIFCASFDKLYKVAATESTICEGVADVV